MPTISARPDGDWVGYQQSILAAKAIWIVDAHRDDGKRFIARSDEKLTAFLELNLQLASTANCLDYQVEF